ncbi:methyltransferase family protein [Sediminimonas qiaohouensis]|uniref:methyltransferase family protein n=1 Tax=Sediminimonas qiaohouensis TaxID=552061 RepID=UPI003B5A13C2
MLKYIDLPPVWLLLACVAAWAQPRLIDAGLSFGGVWADFAAGLLVGGGVLLMLLAVYEMRQHRTTIMPHREADQMVTSGIFSRSRNPIYLGDVLVLAGVVLTVDAPLALPLIPIFLWIIERRFVIPEENRLRRKFRADFARYCQKTRRWL